MKNNKSFSKCITTYILFFILLFCSNCLMAGIVANYSFNEGSGTVAADSSGNANSGAVSGASWVPVSGGYALEFDGIDDYVNCGNGNSLKITGAITLQAWICPSKEQLSNESTIAGKGPLPSSSSYMISYDQNNQIIWNINGSQNTTTTTIIPGRWTLITAVFDKTYLRIYVNGKLSSERITKYVQINSGANFFIGCSNVSGSIVFAPFKGLIDDIKVYNNALTSTEVSAQFTQSDYNLRNSMFSNGIKDSLVAHYRMNEGTGTTLTDSSGHGNTATISGASWLSAAEGYALSFDGINDYVSINSSNSLNIRGPITTSSWVNLSNTQNSYEVGILGKGLTSFHTTYCNGQIYWYVEGGTASGDNSIFTSLTPNTWVHVVTTFDGNDMTIYINGQQAASKISNYSSINQGTKLYIGCIGVNAGVPEAPIKGKIDEVKVFNKALSSDEVNSLYKDENEARNGLVAYYKFNEGSGNSVVDASGRGNSGTVNGAGWIKVEDDNYALSFDGVNDYVDCGARSSLDLRSSMTTISWICPWSNQYTVEPGIMGKGFSYFLLTYYINDGRSYWYVGAGGNDAKGSITTNTWSQVATVFDASTSTLKLFINGQLVDTDNSTFSSIPANTNVKLTIGCAGLNNGQPSVPFRGIVDEVKIYNRALTNTEVTSQFTQSERTTRNEMFNNGLEDGLVASYNINEGSGIITNDSSGFDNTGFIDGAKWRSHLGDYMLYFDGISDNVSCGASNALDINGPITIMGWVRPSSKQLSNEPGIFGRGFNSYLLTYYQDSQNVFYINNETNNLYAAMPNSTWSLVTASFDSTRLKIYIDGALVSDGPSSSSTINSWGELFLGKVMGDGTHTTKNFRGFIDGVKVYNRALSAGEIAAKFSQTEKDSRNSNFDDPDNGLVAYYKMDEASGNTVYDYSGYGNTGTIYGGASRFSVAGGKCIKFDGVNDYVDCGNAPSLDIQNALTVMYWVSPASSQSSREPGIMGKDMGAFQTTYYTNSNVWSYINSGGNNANAEVPPNIWSLVTTTFDGVYQRIYVNGKLITKRQSLYSTINQAGNLYIGRGNSSFFAGYIDEVKVYNRALSDNEIAAQYTQFDRDARNTMLATDYFDVTGGQEITNGNLSIKAGTNGGVQISNGLSKFILNSSYSYPGTSIGYNKLSQINPGGESVWSPVITKVDSSTLKIQAAGSKYSITRYLKFNNNRIEIEDTLTNNTSSLVGILIDHYMVTPATITSSKVGMDAACPLIFFEQPYGDWGIIGEDNIGRLQFNPACVANTASIHHTCFGLDANTTYTFKYAVYPLEPTGDVFNLINRVRNDWGSNVKIEGPWEFLDVGPGSVVWQDKDTLRKFFQRTPLNVVGLSPWLDYDPGSMDHVLTREEYKTRMMDAAARVRAVNPQSKIIGCIETDWVAIDPSDQAMFPNNSGQAIIDHLDATSALENSNLPWKDSFKRVNANQSIAIEYYSRGGKPQYAAHVYPTATNYQRSFLLNQTEFIMDECGLDGFYIDEFSQAWGGGIRSYAKAGTNELQWDGFSVDIDQATGNVVKKFVDCGLAGISPRVDIINSAYSRGKIATANTYSTSKVEQTLGINRFSETWWYIDVDILESGVEPNNNTLMFSSVLGTPIGLGSKLPDDPNADLSERLMLVLMQYLKHGMVYYHYVYSALPETGFGSGEYGPINHMLPITPIELHKGWIKGQERLVSCVSYTTNWTNTSAYPHVHFFDDHGREIPEVPSTRYATITGTPGNWNITVKIRDWAEFAIIEEDNTGLAAYYKMDEGEGTTLVDASGESNTGTIMGSTGWTKISNNNYALDFDGYDDYVDCGNKTPLDIKGPITMSGWICPYGNQMSYEVGMFGKSNGDANGANYLFTYSNNNAFWYISSGSNKAQSAIPSNRWSLVTATFDGANLKLYINGQLVSTQASSVSQISQGNNFLIGCIGTLDGLPTNAFRGLLDEIKVYRRVISDSEISSAFTTDEQNARNAIFDNGAEDGLVAYYKFDEGSGNAAIDYSGHNNTGNISGASWQSIGTNQYALSFDGIKDYVNCGSSSSLDLHKYMTAIFWINPAASQIANEPGVIGKGVDSYATTYFLNSRLYLYISGGTNYTYGLVSTATWSQIATTFDGITLKTYKNGVLLSQNPSTQSVISPGYNLFIGCRGLSGDVPSGCFKGSIDNIKIYNRTLTDSEIASQFSYADYSTRNNIQPTTIVNAKNLPTGSSVYIKDTPVSAKIYNPDGSYGGFAIEESDRFAGIRVITSTVINTGHLADVFGATYLDNGELVIDARYGVAASTGTSDPIAPYSIATVDTGGVLKGSQGAVLDNAAKSPKYYSTALNNIGMLMRIRGIVTAVGSDYFYVNDGYGITEIWDGSGYKGIKCGKGNLAILPAVNDHVEVTGVVGVKKIGGYNTRYLWTTNIAPATISTYAFYVYAGSADNANMISLPAQPVNPDPSVIFGGIDINNNLVTYNGSASSKIYTTETASAFGGINYSYGYAFECSQSYPFILTYAGYNDPTPLDRWISVPNGVSGGSVLVGVPYNHATKWNDWHATDGTALKSIQDADTGSWLDSSGNWYSNGVNNLLSPGDILYQNYGYKIKVNKKLAIISPSNSKLNKIITGTVVLKDLSDYAIVQAGQIPIFVGINNGNSLFRAVLPTQITPNSGSFTIDVDSGIYDIYFKASHWLTKAIYGINTGTN